MTEDTGRVLIVEDDPALQRALVTTLEDAGYDVLAASDGRGALDIAQREPLDLVVTDVQMSPMDGHELLGHMVREVPGVPVLMMTAYGTVSQAVAAMRGGAVDFIEKPFEASELESMVARFVRVEARASGADPVTTDPRSIELLNMAVRVARADVTVLLEGESGTGKEVIARFIHENSSCAAGPFVAINCAAIPDQMLEAVLFGYEKGAFTGAEGRRDGKFLQANGGTLLLDEISEMNLALQAKLLRVLQEQEVEPLGAKQPMPLNVRVIATTNRDLRKAVEEGEFREDLFYRLNVFPLTIPPLRERPGDIRPLVERFLETERRAGVPRPEIGPRAWAAIERARWPGNVRELRNAVQRALVLSQGEPLHAQHFGLSEDTAVGSGASSLEDELWHEEARRIATTLEQNAGNRKATAERLGISARTLRYKLAKMRETGMEVPRASRQSNT